MAQCLLLSYINLAHAISVYAKSLRRGIIMICWEIIIRKLIQGKIINPCHIAPASRIPYLAEFIGPK